MNNSIAVFLVRRLVPVFCSITASVMFFGCSSAPLTDAEKAILFRKEDPAKECKELKTVSEKGYPAFGCEMECVKNKVRRVAFELGGNYIRLDTYGEARDGGYSTLSATVFHCSK